LKKLYDPTMEADTAVRIAMEALYDAADEDSATGGLDFIRRIYPVVITITAADGAVRMSDEQAGQVAELVVEARKRSPAAEAILGLPAEAVSTQEFPL
jgi:proteasome beta subunit